MNPFMTHELAEEHIRDLREDATRAGRSRPSRPENQQQEADVTVRAFAEHDIDAIRLLAALDGKQVPAGAILVAELAGELVAALPLDGGAALADPFRPTADVVALLSLRARQLSDAGRKRGPGLAARLHAPRRRFA